MDDYLGTIKCFAFNFAPRNWAQCDGQLLAISQFQSLFALLGTTYGGDGRTTFALPNLRGRIPIGDGNAPGLSNRPLGAAGGVEFNQLTTDQMATHDHSIDLTSQNAKATVNVPALNDEGTLEETENNIIANHANAFAPASGADTTMAEFLSPLEGSAQSSNVGTNAAINNMQPFLALNYCICLNGIFPPRN